MITVLLAAFLAQTAHADELDCEAMQLARARHDIESARETYRDAHQAYFGTRWKDLLAMADDRDAVLAEREEAWAEVVALRDAVRDARDELREVRSAAADGTLACEAPGAEPVS